MNPPLSYPLVRSRRCVNNQIKSCVPRTKHSIWGILSTGTSKLYRINDWCCLFLYDDLVLGIFFIRFVWRYFYTQHHYHNYSYICCRKLLPLQKKIENERKSLVLHPTFNGDSLSAEKRNTLRFARAPSFPFIHNLHLVLFYFTKQKVNVIIFLTFLLEL